LLSIATQYFKQVCNIDEGYLTGLLSYSNMPTVSSIMTKYLYLRSHRVISNWVQTRCWMDSYRECNRSARAWSIPL